MEWRQCSTHTGVDVRTLQAVRMCQIQASQIAIAITLQCCPTKLNSKQCIHVRVFSSKGRIARFRPSVCVHSRFLLHMIVLEFLKLALFNDTVGRKWRK